MGPASGALVSTGVEPPTFTVALDVVREHEDEVLFMSDVRAADWAQIFEAGQVLEFLEGQIIVHAGEEDRALYFLTEGSVRLVGGTLFKTIDAPSVVGELAFLDGRPRSVGVVGASDGILVRFSMEAFAALAEDNPKLATRMALDLGRVTALRLRMIEGN